MSGEDDKIDRFDNSDEEFVDDVEQQGEMLNDLESEFNSLTHFVQDVAENVDDLEDDLGELRNDIDIRMDEYEARLSSLEQDIENLDIDVSIPEGERTGDILNPMNYFEGDYTIDQFDDIMVSETFLSNYVQRNGPAINNIGEHMTNVYRSRARRKDGMDPNDVYNPFSNPEPADTDPELDDPDKRDSMAKGLGALLGAGFVGGSLAALFWPDDDSKTVYKESGPGNQNINGGQNGGQNGTAQGTVDSSNPNYFEDLDGLNEATDNRDLTAGEVEAYLDTVERTDLEASDVDFGYSGGAVTIYSEGGDEKIATITEDF